MSLLDTVSYCEFLRAMPEALVVQLGHIAHSRAYLPSDVLFVEGKAHSEFHVIVEGHVRLDMLVPRRGRVPILSAGPGDVLAWSALLGDSVMTSTAVALDDVRTVVFRSDELLGLCEAEHEIGYHVMRQLASALSRRLLATRLQLLDLFGDDVQMLKPAGDFRRMTPETSAFFFEKPRLQFLLDELRSRGYCVVGPTISQEAIIYDELQSVDQLPRGWTDEQAAGQYRLRRRDDDAWFGFVVGPHSWKKYLFPPKATLLSAQKTESGWEFIPRADDERSFALLGVRACELAAMRIQDRVFLEGPYQDPLYRERRERLFIISVNCTQAASTCFCTSMKTGPRCETGFDLALTEIDSGFLCEIGSEIGRDVVAVCLGVAATPEQLQSAAGARQQAVDQIERHLDTSDLPGLLLGNLDHPRWKEVGERCLSCTNCTMVCPTCFCSSVTEVRDLNMDRVDRERSWDSCFNPDFSYLGGSPVRNDTASRYRQWLTHKLDSWQSQFGTSGCVGCGRCITWCPVGIDLTEEVAAIRELP